MDVLIKKLNKQLYSKAIKRLDRRKSEISPKTARYINKMSKVLKGFNTIWAMMALKLNHLFPDIVLNGSTLLVVYKVQDE